MSLTVSSAALPAQAASPPTSSPSTAQQTQLNQLVSKYKTDIARKASPDVLAALARQIATAAKALGQQVVLPKASADSGAQAQAQVAPPAHAAGTAEKLDLVT